MVKYKLTKNQNKELNKVWKFIQSFTPPKVSKDWWTYNNGKLLCAYEYRHYIINIIQKNISINKFYEYEKIINKLYWNLKHKLISHIKTNNINYSINAQNVLKLASGSYINSRVHYNEIDKKWYYFKMKLPELDIICMDIMRDKTKYEFYLKNPSNIKNYNKKEILDTYYHLNYVFPNINPMFYNKNSKSYWIKKINLMYYQQNDKNWYKLIVPDDLVKNFKTINTI